MADRLTSGSKGLDMEEMLRAYFFEAGYFVVQGIPFQLEGDDITDIDLWLYERPAAATRRKIIVDIKNKKSPKAVERIIWIKGLQQALAVDSAIVATTDRRLSSKRLAKNLGIMLFDGDAVAKVSSAKRISQLNNLTLRELDNGIKNVDRSRRTNQWKSVLNEARSSLLTGLGAHSGNHSLSAFRYFAHEAIAAQPQSNQAELAVRLALTVASFAMVSLDYIISENAFRSVEERRAAIGNSIRYGQAEVNPRITPVDAALGLVRKYVTNGGAIARQIDLGFRAEADSIPADIIGDFAVRIPNGDQMFQIARELESASMNRSLLGFDSLSVLSRSALGAFLDFANLSRQDFANSWVNKNTVENTVADPISDRRNAPLVEPSDPTAALEIESSEKPESDGPLFANDKKP